MIRIIASRPMVFLAASTSFACLLGQFYGLWSMRIFACTILPLATIVLVYDAIYGPPSTSRGVDPVESQRPVPLCTSPRFWIVEGALGGVAAAVAYDLYRLPFVLAGVPLFKVFGKFGEMLLGRADPVWLVQIVGWTYHFSNGAALGIMFLAMVVHPTPRKLLWGAVAWGLTVEALLLSTPYANFFGLPVNAQFLFLTITAHAIFGLTLGLWCRRRLAIVRANG